MRCKTAEFPALQWKLLQLLMLQVQIQLQFLQLSIQLQQWQRNCQWRNNQFGSSF